MPAFGPIKRKDLVRALKQSGFEGPYSGGKHEFMVRGHVTVRVPNSHHVDIRMDRWPESSVKLASIGMSGNSYKPSVRFLRELRIIKR